MHYLVTGAAGFIGSHLTRRLVQSGAGVSALVKFDDDRSRLRDVLEDIDLREVDLRTAGIVSRALDQIEPAVVFHCAAAGVSDPFLSHDEAIRSNVYGTINLLRAARGRARVIVLRSPGELEALNVYAASKAAAWQFCRMFHRTEGWPIIGVMPFQVYGPGQPVRSVLGAALRAALAGENFPMTDGEQRRDWVYIEDIVTGLLAAACANGLAGQTVELGTGVATSVRAVVSRVFELVGLGRPLIGVLPRRPGETPEQTADADETERLIGWRARVSLETGLQRLLDNA